MAETKIGEALDLLRRDGWCQSPRLPSGERCIIIALKDAGLGGYNSVDRSAIAEVLADQYGYHGAVGVWNDDPETTFADVELVMEKAEMKRLEEI